MDKLTIAKLLTMGLTSRTGRDVGALIQLFMEKGITPSRARAAMAMVVAIGECTHPESKGEFEAILKSARDAVKKREVV